MFERRTTMVVGAGASAEYGLPTGATLKHQIANLLDIRFDGGYRKSGDECVYQALQIAQRSSDAPTGNISSYLHSAWRVRDAMPQAESIDNFIDAHQGDAGLELCGKLAIVRAILKAESESSLFVHMRRDRRGPNFLDLESTWLTAFFQLLAENCHVEQIGHRLSSLTLIVFNYDRCIEHFLYHALQNYYDLSSCKSAELMAQLPIYHPYGTVGALPWQEKRDSIAFGDQPSSEELFALAKKIRTFTEGTDPARSSIGEIRRGLSDADIVLFLGFAYHPLNLDLLKSTERPPIRTQPSTYYGTAAGISASDCSLVAEDLSHLAGVPTKSMNIRNDLQCKDLFAEYWRSLSLARFSLRSGSKATSEA